MKCAVLCNGPSRIDYQESLEYNYVIGCNVPWATVDASVVIDEEVVLKWAKTPELINAPCYFSRAAWRRVDEIKKRDFFTKYFIGIVDPRPEYDSCGHVAVRCMIEKGYTEIDIYGCDSWFSDDTASYTHQFVDSRTADMNKHISAWRSAWMEIITNHPEIRIKFIKKNNCS